MKNDKVIDKEEVAKMQKGAVRAVDRRQNNKRSYKEIQQEMHDEAKKHLPEIIEQKKKDLAEKTEAYMKEHKLQNLPYTKLIEIMSSGNAYNRTRYSAFELATIFEYFKQISSNISAKIPKHNPSLKSFCGFIGVSQATFKAYQESDDAEMQDVANKIDDYFIDITVNNAMNGVINDRVAIFMLKSVHGLVEAKEPTTVIHEERLDIKSTKERLDKIRNAQAINAQFTQSDE